MIVTSKVIKKMLKQLGWPIVSKKPMIKTLSCPLHKYRDVEGSDRIVLWLFSQKQENAFKVCVPYINIPSNMDEESRSELVSTLVARVLHQTEFTLFSFDDDVYISGNVYLLEGESISDAFARLLSRLFNLLDILYVDICELSEQLQKRQTESDEETSWAQEVVADVVH